MYRNVLTEMSLTETARTKCPVTETAQTETARPKSPAPCQYTHHSYISSCSRIERCWVRCPIWCRSFHSKKLDVALNDTMRRITGCLRPTPIGLLPKLAGIAPGTGLFALADSNWPFRSESFRSESFRSESFRSESFRSGPFRSGPFRSGRSGLETFRSRHFCT